MMVRPSYVEVATRGTSTGEGVNLFGAYPKLRLDPNL